MIKFLVVKPVDAVFLLTAGTLISARSRLPDDQIGVGWVILTFILAFLFSSRSLLSYLWIAMGLTILPKIFLELGVWELYPLQENLPWEYIVSCTCDIVLSFVVFHVSLKVLIYLFECVKNGVIEAYDKIKVILQRKCGHQVKPQGHTVHYDTQRWQGKASHCSNVAVFDCSTPRYS